MYQIPNGIKITNAQESNIRKLSSYALNLPEDYKHFDMDDFCISDDTFQPSPVEAKEILKATCNGVCGTAGCLLGHGPVAGIAPRRDEGWNDYSTRAFGAYRDSGWYSDVSREWLWCFGMTWGNNPADGALRLQYWLDYGVPKGFPEDSNEKYYTRKVRQAYDII